MEFPKQGLLNTETKTGEKKDRITQLKESISKKIGYISSVRNQIDSPEVANMSLDEFSIWTESEMESIFNIFPEQKKIIERILFLNVEIKNLNLELRDLENKKNSIVHAAINRHFKDDASKLEQYLNEELESQEQADLEEEALTQEEQEEVHLLNERQYVLETKQYEYIEEHWSVLKNEDTLFVFTAHNFFQKIKEKKEEVSTMRDLFEKGSLEDFPKYDNQFADFIKERGTDIDIKFGTYDVIIYISMEDAKVFFQEEKSLGWHASGTPISFVIKDERLAEDMLYTETHEKGHNKSECLQGADIHNTIYYEKTIRSLNAEISRYQNLKKINAPKVISENTLGIIIEKIRSQIRYLNGEISADIENLVEGNFTAFYFHFLNTAEGLYNIVRQSVSIREDKELYNLLTKEIEELIIKSAEHVKKALFLSMVSRKYDKSDEFFAATLMSPQNMRLAERYLKDELGDDFEFEKSFSTLAPEYVLPEKLHHRIYDVHGDYGTRLARSILSEDAPRGIVPPKNYVDNKKKVKKYRTFSMFEHKFTELFEISGIFNPTELKRFVTFATPERINGLTEDEKDQAIYTLEYAVGDNVFGNKLFDNFFDIHKPEEIRDYSQNIKKLFDILGKQEDGKIFLQDIFDTCFYKAFKVSLPQDNPEVLRNFMESWKGMEFTLERYISDSGDDYAKGWDIEEILEDSKTDHELQDKIINNPQSTQVFQYIKSI